MPADDIDLEKSSNYMRFIENIKARGLTYSMVFFIFAAFVFIIYYNAIESKFSSTDSTLIRTVSSDKNAGTLSLFTKEFRKDYDKNFRFYRPLQLSGHRYEYSLWQYDASGYHIVNIVIHLLSAMALYWLVKLLFDNIRLAFLAALLFLVHPINTYSVVHLIQRGSVIGAGFLIAALIGYIKATLQEDKGDYMMALFCYGVALFSYEGAVIFPLLLLAYHFFMRRRMHVKEFSIIAFFSLAYVVFRVFVLDFSISGPRPAGADYFSVVSRCLQFLLVPLGLYRGSQEFINAGWLDFKVIVGLALCLVMLIYMLKRRGKSFTSPLMGSFFLIGSLTYFTSFWFAPFDIGSWTYIAAMAFCVILALCLVSLQKIKRFSLASVVIACLLVGAYTYLSFEDVQYWKNPQLYSQIKDKTSLSTFGF